MFYNYNEVEEPDGFNLWTRRERLAWHNKRIKSEAKAHKLLGEALLPLSDEELHDELINVKEERQFLESALVMFTSEEYQMLDIQMNDAIKRVKASVFEQGKMLAKKIKSRQKPQQQDLENLARKREEALEEVWKIEDQIVLLCQKFNIDPSPYLKTRELAILK